MAEKVVGLRIEVKGAAAQVKRIAQINIELKKLGGNQRLLEKDAVKLAKANRQGGVVYKGLTQEIGKNTKRTIELREEQKRVTSAVRANVASVNAAKGSYNALTAENRKLSIQARALSDPLGKNAKEFQRLSGRIKTNTDRLKQLDAAMGRQFRNVGDYRGAIKGTVTSFAKLAAGITAGIIVLRSLNRVFGGSIKTIADFQQANANLATILGKNRDEITELTSDAERLGAVTARTATEVTSLQEAYARLGFTQEEILELTESTISGSVALNAELDQTAELVGAVVNSFDSLSTSDAPKIIDQLTAATNNSALNFGKLQAAIPIVAGAANAAGVPFSKLLALLGKLADSGIDASSSATALRNIFIESAAQGESFEQILESIVRSQDKLTASNDEFGKRAAVSAATLANNISQTKELEEALESAGGTADRVAKERLNTLNGAVTLLGSAWEGLILSVDRGEGSISTNARAVVELATEVLSLLSGTEKVTGSLTEQEQETRKLAKTLISSAKIVISLAAGYVAYRTAIIASAIATRGAAIATTAYNTVVSLYTGQLKIATIATRIFNKATKANPIGLLVAAVVAAATAFDLFSDSVDDASASLESQFDKRLDETKEKLKELDLALLSTQDRARLLRLGFTDALRGLGTDELTLTLQLAESALEESLRKQNVVRSRSNKISADQEIKLRVQTVENINREIAKREQERIAAIGKNVEDFVADFSGIEIVSEDELKEARRVLLTFTDDVEDIISDFQIDSLFDEEAINAQEERLIRRLRRLQEARINLERDNIEKLKQLREAAFVTEEEFEIRRAEIKAENQDLAFDAAIEAAQILSDTLFELQAEAVEREAKRRIKVVQAQNDTEQKILEERLRDGIISEAQFAQEKDDLDKKAAAAEQAIAKRAFEENKTLATIQAAINTALAITNALATAPNIIAGIVLAAVAAAAGIAQIAIIQSQTFAKGGKLRFPARGGGVIEGPSHAEGGVPFTIGGLVPAEAEGGEVILNAQQQAKAGGDAFFSKLGVPGFRSGGQVPRYVAGVRIPTPISLGGPANVTQPSIDENQEDLIDGIAGAINDQEVSVSEQAITEVQRNVDLDEGITDFGN